MGARVTNAVMWVRKWAERMPTVTEKHRIWNYVYTKRPYKCLKCNMILEDSHEMYDHVQNVHGKILTSEQWGALRRLRAKRRT